MKDKPNEWVSISDLMSGVMAVVMLLLVMSVLQKTWSDIKHKQEMEQGVNAQRARVGEMLGSIKTTLDGTANEGLVALDVNSQKLRCVMEFSIAAAPALHLRQARHWRRLKRRSSDFLPNLEADKFILKGIRIIFQLPVR
jgi:hypothetical protein